MIKFKKYGSTPKFVDNPNTFKFNRKNRNKYSIRLFVIAVLFLLSYLIYLTFNKNNNSIFYKIN